MLEKTFRKLKFTHFNGYPVALDIEYLKINGCFTVTKDGYIVHRGRGFQNMLRYCDKTVYIYGKKHDYRPYTYTLEIVHK